MTPIEQRVLAVERAARAVAAQLRVMRTRERILRTLLDVREQRILALERELARERRIAGEATRWAARVEREPEPVTTVRDGRDALRRAS